MHRGRSWWSSITMFPWEFSAVGQNLTEHSGAKKLIPQWGDYTHIAPRASYIKI